MSETYKQWLDKVAALLCAKVGVGVDDLSEGPSRDAYDDELTPLEYIMDVLPDYDDLWSAYLEGGF